MSPALHVLFFLKAPIPGAVKTRLAAEIGEEAALEAYRSMAAFSVDRLRRHYPITVFVAPGTWDALDGMRAWLGPDLRYAPQVGGDFGERILNGFREAFAAGAPAAVALGGDCPRIDRLTLEAARKGLARADAVLAPAYDGGYCLLGMLKPHAALFERIDWGTEHVCDQTLERAGAAGLTTKLLDPMEDVDDAASWARAKRLLQE